MGGTEEQTPSKPSKATSSVQEAQTTMPPYPDWSSSMQAYYGTGAPPPFFASTVAAPTPHPYMWGGQHPMMPPYGTPVHYPVIYPPGGIYAHPNIATTPNTAGAVEPDGKTSDSKDQNSAKKSKGNSRAGNEKAAETGNANSGSGNEGASQSGDSGSDGSCDASDDNNQQDPSTNKESFELMLEDGANAQNNVGSANGQGSVPGKPVVAMPATNLNMGMDLWNPSAAGVKLRPSTGVTSAVAPPMVGPDHQWIQDERELKRQKRKQSNRESARRSRLRKQAECEDLQRRVESLSNENSNLREELKRLSDECLKLTSENNSMKEELNQICGPDSLPSLGENNASAEGDN